MSWSPSPSVGLAILFGLFVVFFTLAQWVATLGGSNPGLFNHDKMWWTTVRRWLRD